MEKGSLHRYKLFNILLFCSPLFLHWECQGRTGIFISKLHVPSIPPHPDWWHPAGNSEGCGAAWKAAGILSPSDESNEWSLNVGATQCYPKHCWRKVLLPTTCLTLHRFIQLHKDVSVHAGVRWAKRGHATHFHRQRSQWSSRDPEDKAIRCGYWWVPDRCLRTPPTASQGSLTFHCVHMQKEGVRKRIEGSSDGMKSFKEGCEWNWEDRGLHFPRLKKGKRKKIQNYHAIQRFHSWVHSKGTESRDLKRQLHT